MSEGEANRLYARRSKRRQRAQVLKIIAAAHGDDKPCCRHDTLPDGHPLKSYPCYGALTVDHMNGGAIKGRFCSVQVKLSLDEEVLVI